MDKRLLQRIADIEEMLRNDPCLHEQKHLDAGTSESTYWHYGYMIALRDVLRLDAPEGTTEYHERLFGRH